MSLDVDPGVLAYWDSEGCLPEIRRRLGYRFRLVNAELPARAIVEEPFVARIRLDNDGFAAPYNARDVQLILRHTATGRIYSVPFDADPRTWGPNQPISIQVTVALPRSLEIGVYQFLLNLPDPDRELSRRPEYSIRLANREVWEARTGYNDLKASIDVVAE